MVPINCTQVKDCNKTSTISLSVLEQELSNVRLEKWEARKAVLSFKPTLQKLVTCFPIKTE